MFCEKTAWVTYSFSSFIFIVSNNLWCKCIITYPFSYWSVFGNIVLNRKWKNSIIAVIMKLWIPCHFKRIKIRTTSDLNNVLKHIITQKPSDYNLASLQRENYLIHYKYSSFCDNWTSHCEWNKLAICFYTPVSGVWLMSPSQTDGCPFGMLIKSGIKLQWDPSRGKQAVSPRLYILPFSYEHE